LGIGEPGQAHLLEHAPDPFPELLAEAKVGAHSGDARVAGEARECWWVCEVHDARETSGALDLDAVVEHRDPDVVAGDGVRAVDDGVDEAFHPCVFGNDADRAKTSVRAKRLTHGELLFDDAASFDKLVRDRALDTHVSEELLADSGLCGGASVADDA